MRRSSDTPDNPPRSGRDTALLSHTRKRKLPVSDLGDCESMFYGESTDMFGVPAKGETFDVKANLAQQTPTNALHDISHDICYYRVGCCVALQLLTIEESPKLIRSTQILVHLAPAYVVSTVLENVS
jgi:hypothetical protein